MSRELITSWSDFQRALDHLLAMAQGSIRIYDEDLATLSLESPARQEQLSRVLRTGNADCLQIAVRNGSQIRQQQPSLLKLLAAYGHIASIQETPAQLSHLRDSMILVDDQHALIRFDRDQPRSKLLVGEIDQLRPYLTRFREIWAENGESITGTILGL